MLGLGDGDRARTHYKLIPLDPEVYFIDHLPVARQPLDIAVTVVASLLIAAVATIYPALQASRLLPGGGDARMTRARGAGARRRRTSAATAG